MHQSHHPLSYSQITRIIKNNRNPLSTRKLMHLSIPKATFNLSPDTVRISPFIKELSIQGKTASNEFMSSPLNQSTVSQQMGLSTGPDPDSLIPTIPDTNCDLQQLCFLALHTHHGLGYYCLHLICITSPSPGYAVSHTCSLTCTLLPIRPQHNDSAYFQQTPYVLL